MRHRPLSSAHISTLSPVTLNLKNLLQSCNWYNLATCNSVPVSYYTLENVSNWCHEYYLTECRHTVTQMVDYFSGCNGTIWLHLQSGRKQQDGDMATFINHVLPLLKEPFELITTDGDKSVPSDRPQADKLLASPLLMVWYTQNYDGTPHTKIYPVPIGLDMHSDQKEWPGLWSTDIEENFRQMMAIREKGLNSMNQSKTFWVQSMANTDKDRQQANAAAECLEHFHTERMPVNQPWEEYTKYQFGFSPKGNSLDCHRTWEMLFFGIMVPIVKTSSLDPLYTGLPVLTVKEWTDICQEGFLEKTYYEMAPLLVRNDEILTMEHYLTLAKTFAQNQTKVLTEQT